MNIKDYLHFYLGQKFVLKLKNGGSGYSAPMWFNVDALAVSHKDNEDHIDPILILRLLSDMTEEESKCFYSFGGSHSIVNPKYAINQIFGANLFYEGYNRIKIAHLTQHLLSKGFDLFGLIQAGLAIDKNQGLT